MMFFGGRRKELNDVFFEAEEKCSAYPTTVINMIVHVALIIAWNVAGLRRLLRLGRHLLLHGG